MAPKTDQKSQPMVTGDSLKEAEAAASENPEARVKDGQLWRDLTAYWILGLCNNYGYVIMLSAAHDIIKQFEGGEHSDTEKPSSERECNIMSTGAVLLADIIPALLIKMIAPFLPFWVHTQTIVAIATSVAGFVLVGFAPTEWVALLGIVSTSFSSGLGETVFMAYSSRYNKNVVSTWSSGTGGSGIIGSLSYTLLTSLHLTPRTIMLIMLAFPAMEAASFWLLLRKPRDAATMEMSDSEETLENTDDGTDSSEEEKPLVSIKQKLVYVGSLTKYMLPLTLVYLFEYFINQGLFELVYFKDIWLDKDSQYRWLTVDYQLGVFISRSTVNLVQVNNLWLMSIFQFVNVIYFLVEVIWLVTPNIWVVFAVVFWEGLLGGSAYVNTFYRMSKEVPLPRRGFALGAVTVADSSGVAAAGFLAIPVHNWICTLPAFQRLAKF